MEIKHLLNMTDRGDGYSQKTELTGQLTKGYLLEAQANLMGSEEPLRLKWWEEVGVLYQVIGKLSMK
jgi:hypothetical protein